MGRTWVTGWVSFRNGASAHLHGPGAARFCEGCFLDPRNSDSSQCGFSRARCAFYESCRPRARCAFLYTHVLDLVGIRAGTGTGSSNMCNIDAAPYPAPQAHHLSTLNVCFIPQINDVTVPVWQQDLGVRGHAEEEEGRIKQENEEQDPVERCFTPG